MKKRILLLTILALVLSACLVLSSCDNSNTDEDKGQKMRNIMIPNEDKNIFNTLNSTRHATREYTCLSIWPNDIPNQTSDGVHPKR